MLIKIFKKINFSFSIFLFFLFLAPLPLLAETSVFEGCPTCQNNICPIPNGPGGSPSTTPGAPGCFNADMVQQMKDAILMAAQKYGIDAAFLASLQLQECPHPDGDYSACTSYVGAQGPFQFMPGTWPGYAEDCDGSGSADPWSIPDSACAAAKYLAELGAASDMYNAAASYNGGPGCCYTCGCSETVDYANEVMDRYNQIKC